MENRTINYLLSVIRNQLNVAGFQPQWIKCKASLYRSLSLLPTSRFSPNLRAKKTFLGLNWVACDLRHCSNCLNGDVFNYDKEYVVFYKKYFIFTFSVYSNSEIRGNFVLINSQQLYS